MGSKRIARRLSEVFAVTGSGGDDFAVRGARVANYWPEPGTIAAKNFAIRSSCLFNLSVGSPAEENWQSVELGLTAGGSMGFSLYVSTQ